MGRRVPKPPMFKTDSVYGSADLEAARDFADYMLSKIVNEFDVPKLVAIEDVRFPFVYDEEDEEEYLWRCEYCEQINDDENNLDCRKCGAPRPKEN